MSTFTKATKRKAKLRLTFDGPAGSGKTYSALQLATAFGGPIAVIDTEHGSASKYAGLFDFDTLELETFSPEVYVKALAAAAAANYPVVIVDSLSHAWTGKGGALELVDTIGGKDKFTSGWRAVTPMHNALVDALLAHPGHVICTMRTKTDYALESVNGKQVPKKIGLAPVQRDGMDYEFDVVMDLNHEGGFVVGKTRCPDLPRAGRYSDLPGVAKTLRGWLEAGVDTPIASKPEPRAEPAHHVVTGEVIDTVEAAAIRYREAATPTQRARALLGLSAADAARAKVLAEAAGA